MNSTHNTRRKNKHGRTGARRLPPQPSNEPIREDSMNYRAGYAHGRSLERIETNVFLDSLLSKRNAKDIKGLIEKRIGI